MTKEQPTLNSNIIGTIEDPIDVEWDERDVMLYALSVGAGSIDQLQELKWTTENTNGYELQPIPTFAATLAQKANLKADFFGPNRNKTLHAAQSLTLLSPLPSRGKIKLVTKISGLDFKKKGAFVHRTTEAYCYEKKTNIFTATSTAFINGAIGNGKYGYLPELSLVSSTKNPDISLHFKTWPHQALFFRLTGDRNRLHSDPSAARINGFNKPILHGLCTYGITARLILNELDEKTSSNFNFFSAIFIRPIIPGDDVFINVWTESSKVKFQAYNESGDLVLDNGLIKVN